MLVITRRIGESVLIGDHIVLTVVGFSNAQVRLGIRAPMDVAVHREEVYERIRREEQKLKAPREY